MPTNDIYYTHILYGIRICYRPENGPYFIIVCIGNVTDEKGDLVADSHSIVARWRNYFSQLFNAHGVKDAGQVEIPTAEPLIPEPSAFEVDLAIDKLKSHKSPGIDEIPAELIKAGSVTICLEIHKLLLLSGRMKNCLKRGVDHSTYS